MDGNGWCDERCDDEWWTAMDELMAMDGDGRLIDGDGQWTAMDVNGRRDGHTTAVDSTAMGSKGWLDGDSMGMGEEERCECDSGVP